MQKVAAGALNDDAPYLNFAYPKKADKRKAAVWIAFAIEGGCCPSVRFGDRDLTRHRRAELAAAQHQKISTLPQAQGSNDSLQPTTHKLPQHLPVLPDKVTPMGSRDRSSSPEFSPLAFGEDLAPVPEYKAAGTTEVDFSGLLAEPLKLHEDLKSGCGGQLWPAGMVLAKHMLRYHRDKLQHSRTSVPASMTAVFCGVRGRSFAD